MAKTKWFLKIMVLFLFVIVIGSCGGGGDGGEVTVTNLMDGAIPPPDTVPETTTIQYMTEDGTLVDIEAVKGQVIVLFDSTVSESTAEGLIVSKGGSIIAKISSMRYYLVSVSSGDEMNFISKMRQEPIVTFVMPDIPLKAQQVTQITPNEWEDYLPLSKDYLSWYFIEINAPLAWGLANESTLQEIEIGIIEQSYYGLAEGAEDFSGRLYNIPSFPTIDDHDEAVHGTAVTAFAAATGNNNFGNVGVNWWSKVRLISPPGKARGILTISVYLYSLAQAIYEGSKVINMSVAFGNGDGTCQFKEKIIKGLADEGLYKILHVINLVNLVFPNSKYLVVKAAGNDNCEHTTGSLLKPDNLIIVGASDKNHGKASFSDYGAYIIDIAAPGEDLGWIDYSSSNPIPNLTEGTSFSAPLVAGAAALVWAKEPDLTPQQVIQRLKDTAQPFTNLEDQYKGRFGAGILDVYKALGGTEQPSDTTPPSVPTGLTATAVSSNQIDLLWNASTDDIGVAGYKIYRNGSYLKSVTTTSTSDTGLEPSTQYCYTVSAYDAAGNESEQSNQACATTLSTPDTTPPSVPTGLAVTAISSSQIDLSWNPSTDNVGVAGYKIYRDDIYLKSVVTTSTSDTELTPDTQYCYTVSAYDLVGNESEQSTQVCATTFSTFDLSKGLVAYYPFSGNANDESGNGNDGTLYGNVDFSEGIIGQAAKFDGINSYISVPDSLSLHLKTFTIAAWVKTDYFGGGRIVEKGDSNSYWLYINTNEKALVGFYDGIYNDLISKINIEINNWYFIVGSYNGVFLKIYINGTLDNSYAISSEPYQTDQPLIIGWKYNGITEDHFSGLIDEVHIYNRALSEDEIQELFKLAPDWWVF